MKLNDLIKGKKKNKVISIRITDETKFFLKRHDISPSKVFHSAIYSIIKDKGGNQK